MAEADAKIDWTAAEAKARTLTDAEIHYAILGYQKGLDSADGLDRADGGGRGGYYRDEISVLRRELVGRRTRRKNERAHRARV